MFSYVMIFVAGGLFGSMIMGLFVAYVNLKDGKDDW